jgi:ADP-ribosylglycohydrolase
MSVADFEKFVAKFEKFIKRGMKISEQAVKKELSGMKLEYSKKNIDMLIENGHKSTLATMRERYLFKVNPLYVISYSFKDIKHDTNLITRYPDFSDWYRVMLMVPLYQSLGDTLGYYNGNWEFNYGDIRAGPDYVNEMIYEFIHMGGINDIDIKGWMASDDTIMYIATFEVLIFFSLSLDPIKEISDEEMNKKISEFGKNLRVKYLELKQLLETRDIGDTVKNSLDIQMNIEWDKLPYNSRDIGAGSVMRSGCIGLFFPGYHNRKILVKLAVECSRITHNSAIAIMGCVTTALFTAFSIEKRPVNKWPLKLIKLLKSNLIDNYLKISRPNEYHLYSRDKLLFIGKWEKYLSLRFSGTKLRTDLKFLKNPVQRYKYLTENFSKGCDIPGSCADDCVIMAYDALLQCEGVLEKLIVYSILHPGDSDTVGSVAFSWFAGIYHTHNNEIIVKNKFEKLEFVQYIENMMGMDEVFDIFSVIYYYHLYRHFFRKNIMTIIRKKKYRL